MGPFGSIAQIIMKQNMKDLLNQTQTVQKHNLYFNVVQSCTLVTVKQSNSKTSSAMIYIKVPWYYHST